MNEAQENVEVSSIKVENIRQILKRMEEAYTLAIKLGVDCGIVSPIKIGASITEPYFIVDLVQRKLNVNISQKSRKSNVVEARQIAVYLLHKYTRLSLERIAQYVSLADHSGVLYHLAKIKDHLSYDERIRVLVRSFEKDISEYYEKKNIDESNSI